MTLGHRVAVLNDGKFQQCDAPRDLYERPTNTFVAGFIGSPSMNLCPVRREWSHRTRRDDGCDRPRSRVRLRRSNGLGTVILGLRPEALDVAVDGLPARVEVVEELGADAYVFCVADVPAGPTKIVARDKAGTSPGAGTRHDPPAGQRGVPLRLGDRRPARRLMGQPEAYLPADVFSPRSESSRRRCYDLLEHDARVRGGCAGRRSATAPLVRLVGHGSSDNAASYGDLCVRHVPGWTALRDSITLSVYYGAEARPRRIHRRRVLAVRPHTGCRRLRRASPGTRRADDRDHERPPTRARAAAD